MGHESRGRRGFPGGMDPDDDLSTRSRWGGTVLYVSAAAFDLPMVLRVDTAAPSAMGVGEARNDLD